MLFRSVILSFLPEWRMSAGWLAGWDRETTDKDWCGGRDEQHLKYLSLSTHSLSPLLLLSRHPSFFPPVIPHLPPIPPISSPPYLFTLWTSATQLTPYQPTPLPPSPPHQRYQSWNLGIGPPNLLFTFTVDVTEQCFKSQERGDRENMR